MSSFTGSSIFGSHSTSGVRDVFESYRRSQLYLSDTVSTSATDEELDDQESVVDEVEEEENEFETPYAEHTAAVSYDPEAVIGNLQWDEDLTPGPSTVDVRRRPFLLPIPHRPQRQTTQDTVRPGTPEAPAAREDTPLLHKNTSLTFAEPPVRPADGAVPPVVASVPADGYPGGMGRRTSYSSLRSSGHRRPSTTTKVAKAVQAGQSTFGQTLFNAIAILLGIGMLSEPLAFAYAGWIGGMTLMIFYGFITCYTAKLLAHIILDDHRLRSYSDIGRKAFGPRSGPLISLLFCLELFTVSVALVTLYGDSLHSVLPAYSSNAYKVLGLIILVPTVLMPLSVLSYASILGILSTLLLVVVMFIDGFSKTESPGSLWSPADTSLGPGSIGELGVSFGLFMAGFSGHAVMPSLARDMIDPTQFDSMIDWAFGIATLIYTTIGVTGYLMFGDNVSDEFSQDLMKVAGYNPTLNQAALWGLVLVPVSKFALATRPLNITLEIMLGIETSPQSPDDHGVSSKSVGVMSIERNTALRRVFTVMERALLTSFAVIVSILVPEFGSMMAFLGSFSAFLICVIGPVSAKAALAGRCGFFDAALLMIAVVMAAWGTVAALWSAT